MSQNLDDAYEQDLQAEILRRQQARWAGLCDYCGRSPDTDPCRFPGRHNPPVSPNLRKPNLPEPLDRLAKWIQKNPKDFSLIASAIELPLPKCEGQCDGANLALWVTGSMTSYHHKDGEEDPNKDQLLCPECSAEYVEYWQSMWDEYNSGRL